MQKYLPICFIRGTWHFRVRAQGAVLLAAARFLPRPGGLRYLGPSSMQGPPHPRLPAPRVPRFRPRLPDSRGGRERGPPSRPGTGRPRTRPSGCVVSRYSGFGVLGFFFPSIGKTHEIKSTTFAVVRHPVRGRGTVTLLCGRHHRRPQSFPASQTRLCPQETLAPQPRAPSPGSLGSGGGRRAWRVSSRAVGRPARPHRPSLLWPGPGRRGELPVSCLSPPMNAEAAAR